MNIFPTGSLSGSVITTVWLGVWIVVFFNLRFGWVLSGLVVPGYLVPLMLVKPWSAAVVVVEGAVTYGIVWLYSEKISRQIGFTNFFGRDRFFALLLFSVLVRVCFDVLLWPLIGEQVNTLFNLNFDYRNNLHSFGLIVVALIANQFWKPGFRRGIVVLAVTVFITFLLVRYVLMPFTNFQVGSLAYMYENLAASMLAGPKAYMVLLTTAYIASHFNLRYGWEYSGIMIPALLALEWYQPFKLLVTFVETFIILVIAGILLKLPIFQRKTMEGGRKILFFFNISFAYKLLLSHIIVMFFPQYYINDYFGFGYLLTTLLAVKMHDKEIAARVTRVTLQTSLASLAVATVIGFALTSVPNVFSIMSRAENQATPLVAQLKNGTLHELMRDEQVSLYKTIRRNSVPVPLPEEMDAFQEALRFIQSAVQGKNEKYLGEAQKLFDNLRYTLHLVENKYLVLQEQEPKRGWGMYIVNLHPANALQLQVPDPIDEWATSYSAAALFKVFNSTSMAIAGSRRKANDDGSADVLGGYNTFFYAFQQVFGKKEILQIRGMTDKDRSKISGQSTPEKDRNNIPSQSLLMVSSSLPSGSNLSELQASIGGFEVLWYPSPFANQLRKSSSGSFAELFLTREDRRKLSFKSFVIGELATERGIKSIVGYLQDWLFTRKDTIAIKGSDSYRKPLIEELLFFDQEFLTPLTQFIRNDRRAENWTKEDRDELRVLKTTASAFGYELKHYRHQVSNQEYLILAENEDLPEKRYWGTFIFRLGQANGYIVQVPRPLSERNIFEYSVSLFDNLKARALLISGAHPLANTDGSADVIRQENKGNLFNLVNQVLLRQAGNMHMLVIQCRAFAYKADIGPPPNTNVLIAPYSGMNLSSDYSPLVSQVIETLQEQYKFSVKVVSGELNEAGYEAGGIPQALYLEQTENKEFINLWLSPLTRDAFRQQTEDRLLESHFSSLQLQSSERDLYSYLLEENKPARFAPRGIDMDKLKMSIIGYIRSYDIIALQQVVVSWPTLKIHQIIDINSKQAFLVVADSIGQPLLVANLHPLNEDGGIQLSSSLDREMINRYIDSRSLWLAPLDKP